MTYPREVTARLLDTDGTTVVAGDPLANAVGIRYLEELNGTGNGSLGVPLSEAGATEVTPGRFCQILVEGTARFTFQIERDPEYEQIQRGEEAEQAVFVAGRGWGAVLDRAIVYPGAPLDLQLDTSWRLFSFASPDFPNAGAWVAADELYEYLDGVTYGYRYQRVGGDNYPAPIGFPWPTSPNVYDPASPPGASYIDTYWIWPPGEELSLGFGFFRRTLTLASTTLVTFAVTADNLFTLFLEGVPILGEDDDHLMWQGFKQVTIPLSPGTYTIAAVVENIDYDVAVNPAGFIMNAFTQDDAALPATHLLSTDDQWVTFHADFTEFWPGWTPGQIIAQLTSEAIARGALSAYAGDSFADLTDTAGAAWDSSDPDTTLAYAPAFAVEVGTTILAALDLLVEEGWIDWRVRGDTLTLDAWSAGTVGSTPGVTLAQGVNLLALERGNSALYTNSLLVQWERGYVPVENATEITAFGDEVEDIYTTEATSELDAQRQGRIELQRRIADSWPAIVAQVEPTSAADCPYEGYDLGDYVAIPAVGGGTENVQVLTIDLRTDDEGNAIWGHELNRRWLIPQKVENELLRQIGGKSGYRGAVR